MYPNSAMGTIALMKQTFLDAEWYGRAWGAYEASGRSLLAPENVGQVQAFLARRQLI